MALDFPSNPALGQSFTSDGAVYTWNGYAWTGGLPISLATPGVSGLMPGADKTKLDGIQPGATANLANSALLARANHTGTQLAATISDFNAAVAAAGGGGGGGGMTDAQLLARANHTGTQVAATISDLTSAVNAIVGSGGGGMSDAALLARANHTGTQLAATISDFAAAVAALGGAGMTEAAITKLYGLLTPFMSTTIAGGNGATNDSPSIQEKINAVVAKGRGTVFLPPGRFRIDNRLSVANSSLRLQGAGVEQTFLEVPASNTVGAIAFTANDKPGGSPYLFEVCDLSIVAVGNGPHGTAIDARWASPNQLNPGLTNLKINNVNVRSETYVAGPGWPTWTNGVYVQNAAWTNIDNLTVFAVDSSGTIGVNLDYPMNSSAFGIMINKLNHNGGGAGVRSRGWMETLYLTNSLIVGSTIGVDLDARSTPYGNMQFAMNNTHINAKNMNVYAYNWRALAFNNNSIYSGLGHGIDQEGTQIWIQNGDSVQIAGNQFENAVPQVNKAGIQLINTQGATVTGNTFHLLTTGVVLGANSGQASITGNSFRGGAASGVARVGVYCNGSLGQLAVVGNQFSDWDVGIDGGPSGPPGFVKNGNSFVNVTTPTSMP